MRVLVYTNALVILSHRICYVLARVYAKRKTRDGWRVNERDEKTYPERMCNIIT